MDSRTDIESMDAFIHSQNVRRTPIIEFEYNKELRDRINLVRPITLSIHGIQAVMNPGVSAVMTDARGVVQAVNDGFEEVTGFAPGYAIGRNCNFLQIPHDERNKKGNNSIRTAMRNRSRVRTILVNVTNRGNEFCTFIDIRPIFGIGKKLKGFYSIQVCLRRTSVPPKEMRNLLLVHAPMKFQKHRGEGFETRNAGWGWAALHPLLRQKKEREKRGVKITPGRKLPPMRFAKARHEGFETRNTYLPAQREKKASLPAHVRLIMEELRTID